MHEKFLLRCVRLAIILANSVGVLRRKGFSCFSRSFLAIVLFTFVSVLFKPGLVTAATATVTDVSNPDAYTCGQSGYIDFERMPDGTNLSSGAINGVQFTTTNGFTWLVGDFATGHYNGKYPNGGYTSQGTHWAWLGIIQGAGRIDFVDGPASVFSLLTSDNVSAVRLDAYNADNTLLATAGPASINYNTGHMDELKITRDTADIAYVIVHDEGNFFLVDSICTNASGVPRQDLHDFKQNRNADGSKVSWADDHLYDINSCGTMEGYGCAITSLTDVLASFGLQTLPGDTSLNPGTLNHYLGLPSNVGTRIGCSILWAPAGKALDYTIDDYRPPTTSYDDRIARINEALDANNLVILGIPQGTGKHFMVLYKGAPNAPDGSPDYFIADPYRYQPYATGDRSGKTLYQAYNKTLKQMASGFQIEIVGNKAPQPGRAWAIVAHSPVEMLITDPNGAQTGFNPVTGSYVLNIPDTSYGIGDGIEDDSGVGPRLPDILYFGQNQLEDGVYMIQVIGTGSGPYTLDFAVASGPGNTFLQTVAGTALPGQTDTYIVFTAQQPISIQRQVQIDLKPGSFPNSINLGSQGKVPVAVLGSATFDATKVDPATVTLAGAPIAKNPKGKLMASFEDVNGDGLLDLVVQVDTQTLKLNPTDTQATLTGKTFDGLNIVGSDSVRIVPPADKSTSAQTAPTFQPPGK
jgi:hypothetical protein